MAKRRLGAPVARDALDDGGKARLQISRAGVLQTLELAVPPAWVEGERPERSRGLFDGEPR